MPLRSFLRTAAAVVALLALASPAFAGGVAVTLDKLPEDLQAGVAFSIGFAIKSAHGDNSPETGLQPVILAANPATDEEAKTTGRAEGADGHYVATLTLPSAGTWQWRILPFGGSDYTLALPGPLEVRAKGAAAPKPAEAAPPKSVEAKATDSSFDPKDLTVAAGTMVIWHMTGSIPHTITASDGSFSSGNLEPGTSYSFTFAKPGTYLYYCEYHGTKGGEGMAARIVVAAAPLAEPAPLAPLPRTGGADVAPFGALVAALLAAAFGLALRWHTAKSRKKVL
jgi:plastocyanin